MRLTSRSEGDGAREAQANQPDILERYGLLDCAPHADYQALITLTARLCSAPVVYIALRDVERSWLVAGLGIAPGEQPAMLAEPLCGEQDLWPAICAVHDASHLRDHPLVSGPPHVRAMFTAALFDKYGERLGSLTLAFMEPTLLEPHQLDVLDTLRQQVEAMLDQRLAARQLDLQQRALRALIQQQEALLTTVSHETRNMLASMLTNCEFALEHLGSQSAEVREAIEDALLAARSARVRLAELDHLKASLKQRDA